MVECEVLAMLATFRSWSRARRYPITLQGCVYLLTFVQDDLFREFFCAHECEARYRVMCEHAQEEGLVMRPVYEE